MTRLIEPTTVEVAQRRLLESIGELGRLPGSSPSDDPLMVIASAVLEGVRFAEAEGQEAVAGLYAALGSLVLAVRQDLTNGEN